MAKPAAAAILPGDLGNSGLGQAGGRRDALTEHPTPPQAADSAVQNFRDPLRFPVPLRRWSPKP